MRNSWQKLHIDSQDLAQRSIVITRGFFSSGTTLGTVRSFSSKPLVSVHSHHPSTLAAAWSLSAWQANEWTIR